MQKHVLESVPVTHVIATWKDKQFSYWVYGLDGQVCHAMPFCGGNCIFRAFSLAEPTSCRLCSLTLPLFFHVLSRLTFLSSDSNSLVWLFYSSLPVCPAASDHVAVFLSLALLVRIPPLISLLSFFFSRWPLLPSLLSVIRVVSRTIAVFSALSVFLFLPLVLAKGVIPSPLTARLVLAVSLKL